MFQLILNDPRTEEFILDLIRKDQLFDKGIDSLGVELSEIGGDYSIATIEGIPGIFEGKRARGLPFDRITLFNEGDFYESFDIDIGKKEAEFTADYNKDGFDLRDRWGKNIVDLTEENRLKVIDVFERETIKKIEEVIRRAA